MDENELLITTSAVGAWVVLGSLILTYDAWAMRTSRETLSGACWRVLEHPSRRRRAVLFGSWAVLTKHLLAPSFLPRWDPINALAVVIRLDPAATARAVFAWALLRQGATHDS